MKYTAGQAAKATGVSTATITRALKSGKISGQKDEAGSWSIDPAELHRVFPALNAEVLQNKQKQQDATDETPNAKVEATGASIREVELLREALNDLRNDRDRWREMAERLSLAPPQPAQSPPERRSFWKFWK